MPEKRLNKYPSPTYNPVMTEIWKQVVGYEGFYLISNLGRIKSLYIYRGTSSRIKKLTIDDQGYLCVILNKNSKSRVYRVHTLVLTAFCGPRPVGSEACHSDGNKQNPRLNNLRWGTRLENARDAVQHGHYCRGETHGASKLTDINIREIRLLSRQGISQRKLANQFGVTQRAIWGILNGKTWRHIL